MIKKLEEEVWALKNKAQALKQYIDHYYGNDHAVTHGQWEDRMRLEELDARIVDLEIKLYELKSQEQR